MAVTSFSFYKEHFCVGRSNCFGHFSVSNGSGNRNWLHCWLCRFPACKLLQDSCRNRVDVSEMLLLAEVSTVSVRGHDSRRLVLKGYGKIGCVEGVVVEFSC